MNDILNRNFEDKSNVKADVSDNTDTIIELAEMVGE